MRVRFNSIEGDKIRTIGRFQSFGAMFVQLHDHLEDVGMFPEEFGISPFIDKYKRAGSDFYFCSTTEHSADGHGIFFEISAVDEEGNRAPFVTGSTPGNKPGDYLRMARIAAECCIMLNGFDNLIAVPEDIRRYLDSKQRDGDIRTAREAFVEYAKDELLYRDLFVREAVIEDNRSEFDKAVAAGLDMIALEMASGRIETESLEKYSCTREQFRAFCGELLEDEGFTDGLYTSMTDELWEFYRGINKARKIAHENEMAFDEAPYDPDDYDEDGGDLNEYACNPARMSPEDLELLRKKRPEKSGERVVETRKLGADNLSELCCEHEWCNHVDNERYNDLLTFADKDNITAADILYIAERIDEFTSGSDYNGHIDSICFEVAKKCWSTFQVKEV